MINKKIKVRIGSLEEAGKEFIDIWHQVEQKKKIQTPIEKITFTDQKLLFKTLAQRSTWVK